MFKKTIVYLSLLALVGCKLSSSGPMDTRLTAENRQSVVNQAIPKMSQEDIAVLMAYTGRQMMTQMGDAINQLGDGINNSLSGKPAVEMSGDWDLLPAGQTLNEIIQAQKTFDAAQ